MLCASCQLGNIRVITMMTCSCNHHNFLCDHCFKIFTIPCGPPYSQSALPPEFSLREEILEEETATSLFEMMGQTTNELYQALFKEEPDKFPLVDDFRRLLSGE